MVISMPLKKLAVRILLLALPWAGAPAVWSAPAAPWDVLRGRVPLRGDLALQPGLLEVSPSSIGSLDEFSPETVLSFFGLALTGSARQGDVTWAYEVSPAYNGAQRLTLKFAFGPGARSTRRPPASRDIVKILSGD